MVEAVWVWVVGFRAVMMVEVASRPDTSKFRYLYAYIIIIVSHTRAELNTRPHVFENTVMICFASWLCENNFPPTTCSVCWINVCALRREEECTTEYGKVVEFYGQKCSIFRCVCECAIRWNLRRSSRLRWVRVMCVLVCVCVLFFRSDSDGDKYVNIQSSLTPTLSHLQWIWYRNLLLHKWVS